MEYGLLVATFVAIMVMGLELGIAAGIIAASLLFAYNYSKVCFSTLMRWSCATYTYTAFLDHSALVYERPRPRSGSVCHACAEDLEWSRAS